MLEAVNCYRLNCDFCDATEILFLSALDIKEGSESDYETVREHWKGWTYYYNGEYLCKEHKRDEED